ncbi:MAG: serpin family protein [Pseudomonadota bacterium]
MAHLRYLLLSLVLILGFIAAGCGSGGTGGGTGDSLESAAADQVVPTGLRSEKTRSTIPSAAPDEINELVGGNKKFAVRLYHKLEDDLGGNLFYSPYGISFTLAMAYAGSHGYTEEQMTGALSFSLPQERLHDAFNALDLDLAGRAGWSNTASVWGQGGHPFLPDFCDKLCVNYGAELYTGDFKNAKADVVNG